MKTLPFKFSKRPTASRKILVPNGILLGLFILIGLALITGGYVFYRQEYQQLHQENIANLQSIASLKIDQINQWRLERLSDAQMISSSPFMGQAIGDWIKTPGDPVFKEQFPAYISKIINFDFYQNVIIATPSGQILFSYDPTLTQLSAASQELVFQASTASGPLMGDFFYPAGDQPGFPGFCHAYFRQRCSS